MADERRQLSPGMQVSRGVTLRSPLGEGGMGAVWLADHAGLQTQVVVKFMIGNLDASTHARARFAKEAAAAAQVKSPHVVQMLDHGITDNDVPFIVMEHLVGKSLGQYMDDHGRMTPQEVVAVVSQVGKALARVHAAGLLHRDIKPDNIFMCDGDDELFVKLLDFGIVKDHTSEPSLDGKTKTGQVVGTPFYMSPEQMNAEKNIDARSDLWSLAVVAFEALTGVRPFQGQSFGALAVAIVTTAPQRASALNPSLPPSVDGWFERALARDPANRFATAREMSEGLRAAFSTVMSMPPSGEPSGPSLSRSGPRSMDTDVHARTERVERVPTPIELDATQRQDQLVASQTLPGGTPRHRSSSSEPAALARSEPAHEKADLSTTNERAASRRSKRRGLVLGVAALVVVFVVVTFLATKQGGVASSASPAVGNPAAMAIPAADHAAANAQVAAAPSAVATATAVATIAPLPSGSGAPLLATAAPNVRTEPPADKARVVQAGPSKKSSAAESGKVIPADVTPAADPAASTPVQANKPAPRSSSSDSLY